MLMPKSLIAKFLLLVIIGAGLGAIAQAKLFRGMAPLVLLRQSDWLWLSTNERMILRPLAERWEAMSSVQQQKWRALAKKYPSLSEQEQQKLQRRMKRWAGVAPEQRAIARKKYQTYKLKKPEEQERLRSVWQRHQEAKTQDKPVSIPSPNENSIIGGTEAKELEGAPSEQHSPVPSTEGIRYESQK
jgi:hypothetical protein